MLVAWAQLNFIHDLVPRFERDCMMRLTVHDQSHYVAIIALLQSIGHVFEKVDGADAGRRSWIKTQWVTWKRKPGFGDFVKPTCNALLNNTSVRSGRPRMKLDLRAETAQPAGYSTADIQVKT